MRYMYRGAIFLLTIAIFICTYMLQNPFGASGTSIHHLRAAIPMFPNGITLIWVLSFPVTACLWLGWILFLQYVPWRRAKAPESMPGTLYIRYVTRGINVEAIRFSVDSAYQVFAKAGLADNLKLQVISDRHIELPPYADLWVVPAGFETPNKSLFKAKALCYAQINQQLQANQWVLYLDEESRVTESALQGIVEYMECHHSDLQAPIGQGPIVYTGGHWFWRGADALRLADDLGRFQLQYRLGAPIFGSHGSYLLLRGDVDKALPFDVGPENSLTEDVAWSLHAWQQGFHFRWVNGFILEQPPGSMKDFLKQRQRWLFGMKMVVKSRKIRFRYKIALSVYTYLWQISFATILLSVALVLWGIHPLRSVQVITEFSSSIYVAAYLIGNIVTSYITRRPWMILTTALYPIYGLLESLASVMVFRKLKTFHVVDKPRADRTFPMVTRENP